jgi:hypothetical protein
LSEDVFAVFLTWLATWNPYFAASIVVLLLVAALLLVRWIFKALRNLFRGASQAVDH